MNVYRIYKTYNDNYVNHQMLKEIFPENGKLLFQNCGNYLMVVTAISVNDKFKDDIMIEHVGSVGKLLKYNKYNFSIRLNSVKECGKNYKNKRLPINIDEIDSFVNKKLTNIGANVKINKINKEGIVKSIRKGIVIPNASVFITGSLDVTDRKKFINTIENGIGYGKVFGFGLLNVF